MASLVLYFAGTSNHNNVTGFTGSGLFRKILPAVFCVRQDLGKVHFVWDGFISKSKARAIHGQG